MQRKEMKLLAVVHIKGQHQIHAMGISCWKSAGKSSTDWGTLLWRGHRALSCSALNWGGQHPSEGSRIICTSSSAVWKQILKWLPSDLSPRYTWRRVPSFLVWHWSVTQDKNNEGKKGWHFVVKLSCWWQQISHQPAVITNNAQHLRNRNLGTKAASTETLKWDGDEDPVPSQPRTASKKILK